MEVNAFESLLSPYSNLAQANMEVMKKLPQAFEVLSTAYSSVRDSVADNEEAGSQASPTDTYASLMFDLMKNWVQFWSDLGQGMFSLIRQAQGELLEQPQDSAAEAQPQAANAHDRPRRMRAAT